MQNDNLYMSEELLDLVNFDKQLHQNNFLFIDDIKLSVLSLKVKKKKVIIETLIDVKSFTEINLDIVNNIHLLVNDVNISYLLEKHNIYKLYVSAINYEMCNVKVYFKKEIKDGI